MKFHNENVSWVCVCVITCVFVHCAAVRSLWFAGSQKQEEQRLQDYSDGRDDRLVLSPPCAERERKDDETFE